jgi:lysozyme
MHTAAEIACALIRGFEGCVLHAYPDPATGGEPWTIGYGATGPSIRPGAVWTREQAEADLRGRVDAMLAIMGGFLPSTLPPGAVAALASLAYNIGCPHGACRRPPPVGSTSRDCCCCRLETSSVVAKLHAGDLAGAAASFDVWNKAAGKVNPGLVKRRAAERETFLSAIRSAAPPNA